MFCGDQCYLHKAIFQHSTCQIAFSVLCELFLRYIPLYQCILNEEGLQKKAMERPRVSRQTQKILRQQILTIYILNSTLHHPQVVYRTYMTSLRKACSLNGSGDVKNVLLISIFEAL